MTEAEHHELMAEMFDRMAGTLTDTIPIKVFDKRNAISAAEKCRENARKAREGEAMNDNDVMKLADIVSSGEECDFDEREMMEWCEGFNSCLDCKNALIHALLSMLRDGPLYKTDNPNEVYVVYRRVEHGDVDELKPSLMEKIFHSHSEAVEWVASHAMTIEPRLCMDTDDRELYLYYYEGFPIVEGSLPEYIISKYNVE